MIYCIVGREQPARLVRLLERFYSEQDVTVVAERREWDRRAPVDRRGRRTVPARPRVVERRHITSSRGRRVSERRGTLIPVVAPMLPLRARRHRDGLVFASLLDVPPQFHTDVAAARAAIALQAGEPGAMRTVFTRHLDDVLGFCRMVLRDEPLAEETAQLTFLAVKERIGEFDAAEQPFRAWLFGLVLTLLEPLVEETGIAHEPGLRHDGAPTARLDLSPLEWVSDQDLQLLVERMPWPERADLLLRYMVGLSAPQAAELLGRSQAEEAQLHDEALRALAGALHAFGASAPRSLRREHMTRLPSPATVLRRRLMALR
jgi:DNA-directed RNA polymerase specialized sigma24 family protein